MDPIKTELLNDRLLKSDNFKDFYEEHRTQIRIDSFNHCLYDLIQDSGLKNAQVFLAADMSESYGYQLLSGKRQPSRDTVLRLGFGLNLSIEQTNTLLKLAEKSELYVKNKRDAIIMFALNNHYSILQVNTLLEDEEADLLDK